MMLQMNIQERVQQKQHLKQQEWTDVQTQIRKQTTRCERKEERVHLLTATKASLENQIACMQQKTLSIRHQRQALEDQYKQQQLQRQREAERVIQIRLRQEESQRLREEETQRQTTATAARTKAKERVATRTAFLTRVLHGCAPHPPPSQNQEDTCTSPMFVSTDWMLLQEPDLAEFEEEGLEDQTKDAVLDASVKSLFQWTIPVMRESLVWEILQEEGLSSDSE